MNNDKRNLSEQYREFYLKFSPNGAPVNVGMSTAQINSIGRIKKLLYKSITTPFTFYSISDINNQLVMIEKNDSGDVIETLITLTPGNYTAYSFAEELQKKMNGDDKYGSIYTVLISNTTGKLSITNNNGGTWKGFQIEFYTGRYTTVDSAAKRLQASKLYGIELPTLEDDAPAEPQVGNGVFLSEYESPYPVVVWGPDQLNVVSPTLQSLMVRRNVDIVDEQADIIARLPLLVSSFAQQTINSLDKEIACTNSLLPTNIVIDIIDETGNSIDFNGGQCYIHVLVSS